ncbi:hypothetical protein [Hyalangium sp.]|uniref:hypothetical protein n=1 Tax=Hyalangium sp. TaxID=2028555 RepID=UPI002D6E1501|nr:hypothetical protein [Hyalangium sp.]HYI02529.1 hypothetical protein [Hyalangium sp.]
MDSHPSLSHALPLQAEPRPAASVGGERARRLMRRWGPLFPLWSIPGLVATTQTYVFYQLKDPTFSFWTSFMFQFPPWQFWALVTPAVLALGRRRRLEAGAWGRGPCSPACRTWRKLTRS